jgi:hypothetical protein
MREPSAALAIGRMHDERLQDAALLDVRGELCKGVLGELGAWVLRILVEHRHCHEQWLAVVAAGLRCCRRDSRRGRSW